MTKQNVSFENWSPEGLEIRDLEIMEEALERLSATILLFQNQPRVDGVISDTLEKWSEMFAFARERVVKVAQEYRPDTHEEMESRCGILLKYEADMGCEEPEKIISIMNELMISALKKKQYSEHRDIRKAA